MSSLTAMLRSLAKKIGHAATNGGERTMASGRQIAEENVQTFIAWVATKNDADYRAMVSRGVL